MPALLTSTSRPPSLSFACAIAFSHCASCVTSCTQQSALPPALRIAATVALPPPSATSVKNTLAPARASARAPSAPTPRPAPLPKERKRDVEGKRVYVSVKLGGRLY